MWCIDLASKTKAEEQRKLQLTGGSTFILSMPKNWVIKNELGKGSSVMLREEDDGSLTIMPPKMERKERQDEAFINISSIDNINAVIRTTISAYLTGYNVLHIKARNQQTMPSFCMVVVAVKFQELPL